MELDVSTEGYISRIKERLQDQCPESLLYAALELRGAVEGRLKYYIAPIEHIPKAERNEWSVAKLGKSLNKIYQLDDHLALITIYLPESSEHFTFRYVPVSTRLQTIANRLGDWLHFPGARSEVKGWWAELQQLLEEGLAWLVYSSSSGNPTTK